MDCAICYENITAATGRSVMSCGHEFHLACLVRWLQKPDGAGNCPCCRAEPTEMERLVAPPSDSDSESDESDESEDDDAGEPTNVSPLMIAIRDDAVADFHVLMADGPDLEAKDSDGDTALCYAVLYGRDALATALMTAGANLCSIGAMAVDGVTNRGSALLAAAMYNSMICARAALSAGADPNYTHPGTGSTALMMATREGAGAIVDLLLAAGANVFALDWVGWNAFMWFAEADSSDVDIMASLLTAVGPTMRPWSGEQVAGAKRLQELWRGHVVRTEVSAARALAGLQMELEAE